MKKYGEELQKYRDRHADSAEGRTNLNGIELKPMSPNPAIFDSVLRYLLLSKAGVQPISIDVIADKVTQSGLSTKDAANQTIRIAIEKFDPNEQYVTKKDWMQTPRLGLTAKGAREAGMLESKTISMWYPRS